MYKERAVVTECDTGDGRCAWRRRVDGIRRVPNPTEQCPGSRCGVSGDRTRHSRSHLEFDEWRSQLEVDQFDPSASALSEWTALDWNQTLHTWVGVLRVWETLQLQVEQGVLPQESLETLGWGNFAPILWSSAAFVCLWPTIRLNTSQSLISIIEDAEPRPRDRSHGVARPTARSHRKC